jgi:NTE family protein
MYASIALGGGGSKGFAHIGVLKILEREEVKIGAIAGTSMGGIIAAAYAAGYTPEEIEHHASETPLNELLRLRPGAGGVISLDKVAGFLKRVLGQRTFADTRVPLAVTAVDLESGRSLTLTEGCIVDAVLATIALPGIFPPQVMGEHRLIDGGAVDPVPVRAARTLGGGPVVAVALSPCPEEWSLYPPANPFQGLPLLGTLARLRTGEALQVLLRTVEIVSRNYLESRLVLDSPEVIVRPRVGHVGLFDQPSISSMVEIGAAAMEAGLPALRAESSFMRRVARRWDAARRR